MPSGDFELIKRLAGAARSYFNSDVEHNIFEDEIFGLKVVKLFVPGLDSPVYYLTFNVLGAGSFGEVSEAVQIDIERGLIISERGRMQKVAIKITDFSQKGNVARQELETYRQQVIEENSILQRVDQSYAFSIGARTKWVNIAEEKFTPFFQQKRIQEAVVAMPLFPGNDMKHEKHSNQYSYGSITFAALAASLSRQLKTIHDSNLIHADLKPANVIWDANTGHVNIVDFNRAKEIAPAQQSIQVNDTSDQEYMAPESLKNGVLGPFIFSRASDVYSLGKIFAEKFNMKRNLDRDGNVIPTQNFTLEDKPYLGYNELLMKPFIARMMSENPAQRPSTQECVDFFDTIDRKMKLDVDVEMERQDPLRIKLNQVLISLEVYANRLRKEIAEQGDPTENIWVKARLTAKKHKKYENTVALIELLVQSLSKDQVDVSGLKNSELLLNADKQTKGLLSRDGRYSALTKTISTIISKKEENESRLANDKPNAILAFAIQHPKLIAGLIGLFIAALVVASVFSCGAVAGVASAAGVYMGLSGAGALAAGTAAGAATTGLVGGLISFFAFKKCAGKQKAEEREIADLGQNSPDEIRDQSQVDIDRPDVVIAP